MTYLLSTSLRDDDDDHENEPNVARWSEVDSCHDSALKKLAHRPKKILLQRQSSKKNNFPDVTF